MTLLPVEDVARRLAVIRRRIEGAGGDPDRVTIVAVTKGFGPGVVQTAVAAGLSEVGESYAQDLLAKAAGIDPQPRWHFIGRLQRNKVRSLAGVVDLWQTIDREPLAVAVAERAPGAHVLVQVNATGEPAKGGCRPGEAPALVSACLDLGLTVRGVMAVGPTAGGPEAARPAFRVVRGLADDLGLVERSMGMTDDLEVAVAEGATMVRVGTALFGPRPSR